MKQFSIWLRNKSFISMFLVMWVCLSIMYILIWFVFYKLHIPDISLSKATNEPSVGEIEYYKILSAFILAPLIETFVFQKLLYHLMSLLVWFKKNKSRIVVIGGTLFGLCHFFSLSHIIVTTVNGIFFMYVYVIRRDKGGFWMTVLLHTMINGLAFVLVYFE